jgi:hypothetical protein
VSLDFLYVFPLCFIWIVLGGSGIEEAFLDDEDELSWESGVKLMKFWTE